MPGFCPLITPRSTEHFVWFNSATTILLRQEGYHTIPTTTTTHTHIPFTPPPPHSSACSPLHTTTTPTYHRSSPPLHVPTHTTAPTLHTCMPPHAHAVLHLQGIHLGLPAITIFTHLFTHHHAWCHHAMYETCVHFFVFLTATVTIPMQACLLHFYTTYLFPFPTFAV